MKLVIGNKNYSSWSLRPWLLLSVHGIRFEEVRIPLYTRRTQAVLAEYTGAGKVPVLVDGKVVVWDSLAICEYVSEQYLSGRGWPAGAAARAEARSCSAEMHSGFFELRSKLPMNCRATGRRAEKTRQLDAEIARIDGLWSDLRARHRDRGLWLFGEFSIADCMFAPVVSRFHTYGISVGPASSDYMQHVLGNEQMLRWYRQSADESEVIRDSETGT